MGGTDIAAEPDNLLTRYLLGELEDPEEEQVELRLLTDPDYAEEFDREVDGIIERYVAGEFKGSQLERVRNYFFKASERQEKLRFALALKQRSAQKVVPQTPWRRYLAIAASVVIIAGSGWFVWNARRPQTDLNEGLVALQQAFPENRPIEGRLSDFKYVPLSNQRGGSEKIDTTQRDLASTLLLKALRDKPSAASNHAVGNYYAMLHQFAEADKNFEAALALEPQNAKIHNDYAVALLQEALSQTSSENNQIEPKGRALEEVQKALELDNSLLEAHFNRALILQAMRASEQAKQAWEEYLQKDSTSPWADEARRNIKLIEQQQRGAARETSDPFEAFLKAQQRSDDVAAWKAVSASYTSGGNEITNRLIDGFLSVKSGGPQLDPSSSLAALIYVAKLESERTGDRFTSDLVNFYQRAGPTLKPILASARYHMQTAYASFQKSQFQEAINEYNRARSDYQQAKDNTGIIFVDYRLAHCYVLRPNPQQARSAFDQLRTICEKKEYLWLVAQCLYGLAHASSDLSEYSKALDFSSGALTQFEHIGDVNGALKSLTQLADLNQLLNQIPRSLSYLSRALGLAETSESDSQQLWGTLNQIGFSMASLKLNAAALFYQKEALQLALKAGIPLLSSRSYSYVGAAYAAMQMYPQALDQATQAFEIGRSMNRETAGKEMMAQASLQLGDIYNDTGRCDEALKHYDYSLQLYRELDFDFHSYVAHKGKLHCFLASANNRAVHDELPTVLKFSELYRKKITDESQRNSFFDAEQEVYDIAIGYEFSIEKEYVKALDYSEQSRARSLLDAVQRGRRRESNSPELNSSIVTLPLPVTEIQKRMPANSQIVQYAVLDDKVAIWVVTQKRVEHEEVPIKAEVLTARVNDFLREVARPSAAGSDQPSPGSELYRLLIGQIERYLDRGRILLIVPDKILNYLPFAALTSPVTSHYLIQDYDLGAAASATLFVNLSALAQRKTDPRAESILSVGNPSFDRGFFKSLRELPASLEESRAVAALYPKSRRLVREQATESATRAELEKADVAHLAMHFVLNEQSEELSGFPLAPETANNAGGFDGFLQSHEISSLNLHRMRLVVLSACQTGIERDYRGEGAVGAARPFFIAGVPTVVASLWPVDSDASAELMVKFHQHRRDGLRVTQALQMAQLEMIRGERYRDPYYWAPFIAIGGLSSY